MNIYFPQTLTSVAELSTLSTPSAHFISPQSSKSLLTIVQDTLLGSYFMTLSNEPIPKEVFLNIALIIEKNGKKLEPDFIFSRLREISKVFKENGKKYSKYCGKSLFSLLLPNTFNYIKKNEVNPKEPIVKIKKGVIYEGTLSKHVFNTQNSILVYLCKEHGNDLALEFVSNVQWVANEYLLFRGFSISIKDCMATKTQEIKDYVIRGLMGAQLIDETVSNPNIREARINTILSNVKELGMKIATNEMKKENENENEPQNGFISTISSGSKGDYFNIAQITSLLGQQNLADKRIVPVLCGGKRTFPYYPMNLEEKTDISSVKKKYESRGYVRHSLIRGLNPIEFLSHAMTGRATLVTTAMNTQNSGYVQRRMIKIMEDTSVRSDNTVRDGRGKIIQFAYGGDSLDRTKTIIRNDIPEFCDISRIVDKLNDEVK